MNKEKKIGVSKVVIQMGDKEATLTVEQARELCDALNALLGEKVVERVIERDNWRPYRWWYVYGGDYPTKQFEIYGNVTGTMTSGGTYTITMNGDGDNLPVSVS